MELLRQDFVLGAQNIQREEHVGMSHGYRCDQTAVGTTNGAGGRNVQLVVLGPDLTVLHVMPGFWHPRDLARELRFAIGLHRLWLDETRTREQKERLAAVMHGAFARSCSAETLARSQWQDFDEREELDRYRREPRDTVVLDVDGTPHVKPICVLMHDRLAARPFAALGDFDMEAFVDYGRPYYDNNAWLDKGAPFKTAEAANRKREREKARADAVLTKGR